MKNLFEMIEMGELVGAESYLHINYQNQIIIIRVNGTTDKKWEIRSLFILMLNEYIFLILKQR